MTESLQEPFRLGRVIRRSFSLWRRNLALLFVLALVVSVPRILFNVYLTLAPPDPPALPYDLFESPLAWFLPYLPMMLGTGLVRALFLHLSQAVVIFAVYRRLRGETATFGESVRGGLRRAWPVACVAVVLFILNTAISVSFLTVVFEARLIAVVGLSYLLIPVISLLLLSPFWVAVPAAVVERAGGFLRRSWMLTRGRRLQVMAILVIVYAVDWGAAQLCRMVVPDRPLVARMVIWWTQDLLLVALAAVVAVVGYHALRLDKEGVDPSVLEDVFA